MDVFNSNGEVYENACNLPPAAETVVTVTLAVEEEESRDVCAGVLRYLIKLVNYSCSVFCKVNYQYNFEYFKIYNVSLVFFIYVMVFIIVALTLIIYLFSRGSLRAHTIIHI